MIVHAGNNVSSLLFVQIGIQIYCAAAVFVCVSAVFAKHFYFSSNNWKWIGRCCCFYLFFFSGHYDGVLMRDDTSAASWKIRIVNLFFFFLRLLVCTHEKKNYSSAPSTPSDSPLPHKVMVNRSSTTTTTSSSSSSGPPMTANRSRLVQELLEQNSAMLQKLKEQKADDGPSSANEPTRLTFTFSIKIKIKSLRRECNFSFRHSEPPLSPTAHHPVPTVAHNPFPISRQLARPPKDVTVKLGLYAASSSTTATSSNSQKY